MDNFTIAFEQICHTATSSPNIDPMVKALILALEHIRNLEVRVSDLDGAIANKTAQRQGITASMFAPYSPAGPMNKE